MAAPTSTNPKTDYADLNAEAQVPVSTDFAIPPPPPGPPPHTHHPYQPADYGTGNTIGQAPPLPQRPPQGSDQQYQDDVSNPTNYTRDPHKLIAYLIPFPAPVLPVEKTAGHQVPTRFLIYTPPPPPLQEPKEGEPESRAHKLQRKWQNEVRSAKQSTAKTASWKGVKSKATKGIAWAMNKVTSADLDFLNRVPGTSSKSKGSSDDDTHDTHADDGKRESAETHRTVGLEEMVLVYPSSFHASPEQVREEFVNSMMRTKSKAQKDAVLATGLLPVSAAIDLLATVVWPFGGLLEVDGVWAYASIRGAKTARGVTKRLTSTSASAGKSGEGELRLHFVATPRMEVLKAYLATRCSERDPKLFAQDPTTKIRPTESEVLEAIGWTPSERETRNWEDEQWELEEVKEDLKATLGKGARAWEKWCRGFEKDPEKALKK